MEEIEWHFGDVVRKLRERRRWNQTKLAKLAGMNKSTVVAVENNSPRIQRDTMEKIAAALDTSIAAMFALIPEKGAHGITPGAVFRSETWDRTHDRRVGHDRRAEHR